MNFPSSLTRVFIAGSLSVATLAGCPNAGTAPPLQGDAKFSPAPAVGASAAPGAVTSPVATGASAASPAAGGASAAPASGASPTVKPSAAGTSNPAPSGEKTILQGKIYDEEGATIEGAEVTVKSLDTRAPYSATTASQGGNYVINNVPVGTQIEVSVTKAGWTRRTRVTSLQANVNNRNTLDFGTTGTSNADDLAGEAYFVSNYPEVVSATPGSSPVAADKLTYKIRFSETLDADARTEVEDAFIIDTAAAPTDLIPDDIAADAGESVARIAITENSSFLDGAERVKFTWNAENTEMSVAFNAPLRALDDEDKTYRFRLLRASGADLIEDAEGNVLGRVEPGAGVAYFAVKKASLTFESDATSGDDRWEETHQQSSSFDVAEDDVKPKLVSVDTSNTRRADHEGGDYLQVDLVFSEAMRVYPDAKGYVQELIELENYVFAFSDDGDDLDGVDLEEDVEEFDTATDDATDFENDVSGPQNPIRFAEGSADNDQDTDVFIEPSDEDAKMVSIFIPESVLPANLEQIKVLVDTNVKDPAGNQVSELNEDTTKKTADNVAVGDL